MFVSPFRDIMHWKVKLFAKPFLLLSEAAVSRCAGLRLATLLKKRLWNRRFPVNFAKFLRAPFFIEQLWRLILFFIILFPHTILFQGFNLIQRDTDLIKMYEIYLKLTIKKPQWHYLHHLWFPKTLTSWNTDYDHDFDFQITRNSYKL